MSFRGAISVWVPRLGLAAVFVSVAWFGLKVRAIEELAWRKAAAARTSAGCAEYLEWATATLDPRERQGQSYLVALLRTKVAPWVSSIEPHIETATKCPASIDSAWSR